MDWQLYLCIGISSILLFFIIYLYYKNKIDVCAITSLGKCLDLMDDNKDFGIVAKLAEYAKYAVRAVEQMVNSGIIPKENEVRKEKAMDIVINEANIDKINIDKETMEVIDHLVESEVYNMKQDNK